MTMNGNQAIVLGGSVAGILTARVLAEHYAHVTLVERDRFPAPGVRRRGVPQDRHIHALQTRGKAVIDQLFPGASEELAEQGAVLGDWGRDSTMCFRGHRLRPAQTELELLAAGRPLLEGHLRARLGRLPGVTIVEDCAVHGLVLDETGSNVTGVRVLRRADGSAEEVLDADLVVDATGRASRLPDWMEAVGYPAPESQETGLDVAYTSCRFPRLPSDDKHVIIVGAVPPEGRRGGGAIAVEGDSWLVTLGGLRGEQAPTEPEAFVDYARTLPVSDLYDLVRDREPLGEPVLMRYPTSRRRRYDRLERFPERLVVTGDALCSFNPVYGQGMSVAAVEALALGRCLEAGQHGIGRRFFAAVDEVVGDAWKMAASGDAEFLPEVARRRAMPERLIGRYMVCVLQAAAHDAAVSAAFREVMAMTRRPPSLLHPRLAARVLAATWRTKSGPGPVRSLEASAHSHSH